MRLYYYPETDSLYIDVADRPAEDSVEVSPGVVVDLDAEGRVVGIDVDRASKIMDLSRVTVEIGGRQVAQADVVGQS